MSDIVQRLGETHLKLVNGPCVPDGIDSLIVEAMQEILELRDRCEIRQQAAELAEQLAKQQVQREMAALRAEIAALNHDVAVAQRSSQLESSQLETP